MTRLEQADIMTGIEHSEWGSPAVIVPKTGGGVSRLALPTTHSIDGVLHELRNGKIFCILDLIFVHTC